MEFLKNSREWVRGVHSSLGINHGVDIMVLKNKIPGSDICRRSLLFCKSQINHLQNFWLFYETRGFFKGIEITGIRGSLTLIGFSNNLEPMLI
jgi:hypothetical protein